MVGDQKDMRVFAKAIKEIPCKGEKKVAISRAIDLHVYGNKEGHDYSIAPCGGVKNCPKENYFYIVPTKEHR